jgi:hypothetical protein
VRWGARGTVVNVKRHGLETGHSNRRETTPQQGYIYMEGYTSKIDMVARGGIRFLFPAQSRIPLQVWCIDNYAILFLKNGGVL